MCFPPARAELPYRTCPPPAATRPCRDTHDTHDVDGTDDTTSDEHAD
jgi:hypothetical protein